MTGTELATTHESAIDVGAAMYRSGLFPDVKKAEQAVVKILAGREFGLGPVAAMSGIHIIDGKPSAGSNVYAGLVKGSARYDYEVVRFENEAVELRFIERRGDSRIVLGTSSFTKADAMAAGLWGRANYKKHPRGMLFARAVTMGVRTYCPDVCRGVPAYTPEELDPSEDADEYGAPVHLEGAAQPTAAEPADADKPDAVAPPPAPVDPDPVDAVVVESEPSPEALAVVGRLRAIFDRSDWDNEKLRWALVEVGCEDPSDIKAALLGLSLDAAILLGESMGGTAAEVAGTET